MILQINFFLLKFGYRWHDGFSTYYVDSTGLVYKHVADKMMPDNEIIPVKDKPNIAAKLTA